MNPTPVPGIGAQFNLEDLELSVKNGVGNYNFGGSFLQCKVSLCLQKFRSWLLSNLSQMPWSCRELYIICKSEKQAICLPAKGE